MKNDRDGLQALIMPQRAFLCYSIFDNKEFAYWWKVG